jgi:putative endonuclease
MSRARGAVAEEAAARLLAQRGFRLLERNFTCRGGEIDLVCADGPVLVFVEVRARSSTRHGSAAETISPEKRRRIIRAARVYLLARKLGDPPCRFDVVVMDKGELRHIPDAFDAS